MTLSVSVSFPDEMIASFPNSALPKITLGPHYEILVELRDAQKGNYTSIPSRRGGGTYGYLGGLQPNAVYSIVAPGTAFVVPSNPGPLAILEGTNSVNSGNLNRDHSKAVSEFKEWVNLDSAGKKQIMEAVSKTFLSGVFDHNQGFAHLCVRNIIANLFTEYVEVEYQDHVGNRSKLSEPWDANQPFQ